LALPLAQRLERRYPPGPTGTSESANLFRPQGSSFSFAQGRNWSSASWVPFSSSLCWRWLSLLGWRRFTSAA